MFIKVLKIFSTIWITLAGLFILFGLASTWYYEGFGKLQEIMSPFNVINFVMMFIVLAPGLGAKLWANSLERRIHRVKQSEQSQMSTEELNIIIKDYGKYLEDNPEPLIIRDVSVLPHPKENILIALQTAIVSAKNDEMLNLYKSSALFLSDFQKNVGTKPLKLFGLDPAEFKNYSGQELAEKISDNHSFDKYEEFKKLSEKDLNENILPKIKIAEDFRKRLM